MLLIGGKIVKKASIITYGCQMNVNESAKIKKMFQNMGYEITDNIEESDVTFLNTCTVRVYILSK